MSQSSTQHLEPRCRATTLGSLPHTDVARATGLILNSTPDFPAWAQLPKRTAYENMMVQFTEGLPALVRTQERFYLDTTLRDYVEQLTRFYEQYLAAIEQGDQDALESFGLSERYAAGFAAMEERLPAHVAAGKAWMIKGQVTGPFTQGTNLLDQDRRCAYYDEQLRDVIVKCVALKAIWQMQRLGAFGVPVTIFVDEPSLVGFGSQTYLTVSREDVVGDINEVVAAIHDRGGLAGVHCEENTDWGLLMEAELDILDFDAYDHMQAMTLYPAELRAFLDRGGWLGWGIVPTLDPRAAATETVHSLLPRFEVGLQQLVDKGFDRGRLLRCALITPSCGAGGVLDELLAERVLSVLCDLSLALRQRYDFS